MSHDSIGGGTAAISLHDDVETLETAQLPVRPDDTGLPRPVEAALVWEGHERAEALRLAFDYSRVPEELRKLPRWVAWGLTYKENGQKPGKVPLRLSGDLASSTSPSTWTKYEAARATWSRGITTTSGARHSVAVKEGKPTGNTLEHMARGLGFVLNGDGVVVVDLDGCIDSQGVLAPWAQKVVDRFPTWTEVSTTGTGLHLFIVGKAPEHLGKRRGKIEVYSTSRFIALTGIEWEGCPKELLRVGDDFWTWAEEALAGNKTQSHQAQTERRPTSMTTSRSREKRVERARRWLAKAAVSRGDGDASATLMAVLGEIIRGFDLDDSEAREAIAEWNSRCVTPEGTPWPWSDADLDRAIENVQQSHDTQGRPRGWMFDEKPRDPSFRQKLTAILDKRLAVQRTLDGSEEPANKPTIRCDADLPGMVSQVLELLENAPHVYQRSGALVTLSTAPPSSPHELRRVDLSTEIMSIKHINEAYGRELLCELADWTKPKLVKKKKASKDADAQEKWIDIEVLPPVEVVRAVLAPCRPSLGNVRVLTGFVQSPCIRPDGTLLTAPGYDVATGLYHHKSIDVVVPDTPTRDDAVAAMKNLLSIVEDFPFEEEHHKSAWVAAALTSLARHAIDGCVPLFMFEAPQKGSGKSLCARTVMWLTNGSDPETTSWTLNDEEFRKRLLSTGRRGDPFIFLDNIAGPFGGPTLESILTNNTGRFSDRVLGTNVMESVNITSTWLATGNNVVLVGDMDRRIMPIRLDAKCPQPELRTGFKKPDLRGYIRENRAALVSAGLTILRAYICAGKPVMGNQPWGGYEEWCRLIVGAVVWAGLPDPGKGREELRAHDPKAQALDELLCLWPVIDPNNNGLRAQDLVAWCDDVPPEVSKDAKPGAALLAKHADKLKKPLEVKKSVTTALEMLGARDASNARNVGDALKRIRGQTRPFESETERGEHRLVGDTKDRNGVTVWKRQVLRKTAKP